MSDIIDSQDYLDRVQQGYVKKLENVIAKIQSKIKGEIETAIIALEKAEDSFPKDNMARYYEGKAQSLQDLQQWIKDNIEEG